MPVSYKFLSVTRRQLRIRNSPPAIAFSIFWIFDCWRNTKIYPQRIASIVPTMPNFFVTISHSDFNRVDSLPLLSFSFSPCAFRGGLVVLLPNLPFNFEPIPKAARCAFDSYGKNATQHIRANTNTFHSNIAFLERRGYPTTIISILSTACFRASFQIICSLRFLKWSKIPTEEVAPKCSRNPNYLLNVH